MLMLPPPHQVSLVNEQLSDKTSSGQNHVEELVLLRTELAQEKASLAIVQQELRDQAAREVGVVRAAHTRKVKELEAELKKKNAEKGRLDFQAQELRAKVKSELHRYHLICLAVRKKCGTIISL